MAEKHIPDHDLQRVIEQSQHDEVQTEIESHISDCEICQTRLMSFAADPTWRDELYKNLSNESMHADLSKFNSGFNVDLQNRTSNSFGDEFDLETVESMLADLLLPPSHPETLGRLGRYEVESVIGCGGMGVVLRGYDRELQRPVAIKMILPRLSKNGTAKQRFAREARAAAAVLHPNVIAIHGIDKTNSVPWFVMPLIVGPTLREVVDDQGPMLEKDIVQIGMQIASGLAAAHCQGLVHRDIKPENILLDNRVNRIVITDFGLARRESEESMTQTGCLAGTLNYMSPEQAQGRDVDARSDLFSLGSLLYYLAAGVVPFRADSPMGVLNKITHEKHRDIRTLNPDISPTLVGVIDRLLEKETSNRFQSAVELESFLGEYVAHLHHPTKQPAPRIPSSRRRLQLPVIPGIMIAVLLLVSGIVFSAWLNRTDSPPSTGELWEDIKQTYQLEQPDEYVVGLRRLGDEISTLNQRLQLDEQIESQRFYQKAKSIEGELERVRKLLE